MPSPVPPRLELLSVMLLPRGSLSHSARQLVAAAAAMLFGLNMVAIQTVQLLLAPLQLLMVIPLMRTG